MKEDLLKDGLSGLIRAKNEGGVLEGCIHSCIDGLDELIVVYNDCTDNTQEILEELCKQYPQKLKVYPYDNKVLSHNLTKEEYEYATNLPDDSPRLHCNQCNYGLSKVSYKYVVKIDPDQIYYGDEIRKWRNVCSGELSIKWQWSFVFGWFFMMYISAYRRISSLFGYPCLKMIPNWLVHAFQDKYQKYAAYRLQCGTTAVSFSGVNLFYDKEWYIPFDRYNIHPPYNGEGDTLLFKVSERTYYIRAYRDKPPYAVVESFVHPYKVLISGIPVWFHLHANRAYCFEKVKKVKEEHPELFVRPTDFLRMTYKEVLQKMDPKVNTLFQRILFALVHKMGMDVVRRHLELLDRIKIKNQL